MATETTTLEILPPAWSGILSVMLDARANIRRQLDADGCDGVEDGWCSIHNDSFDGNMRVCDTARGFSSLNAWRKGLQEAFRSNNELFQQMAKVADLAVEAQRLIKAYHAAEDEPGGTEVDAALISDLAAVLGVSQ